MIRINRNNGRKTCIACPAQWEFKTDNGDWLYVRYRFGAFSASTGASIKEAVSGQTIVFGDVGDPYDGYMEDNEMENLLKGKVEFYD